jgi:hypothetical protein
MKKKVFTRLDVLDEHDALEHEGDEWHEEAEHEPEVDQLQVGGLRNRGCDAGQRQM